MRDIFICPQSGLLQNWVEACPNADVYPSVALLDIAKNESCLFWLHANINNQPLLAETIQNIYMDFSDSKVVVLSNAPDQAEAFVAMSAGAAGYCHAYSQASVLQELRSVVVHGGIWLGRDLLQSLIGASRSLVSNKPEKISKLLQLLTPREREVAAKAAIGLSNKEIARALDITERTVKAHLSSTFERLDVKDRLQLALMLNDQTSGQLQASQRIAVAI